MNMQQKHADFSFHFHFIFIQLRMGVMAELRTIS